MKPQLTCLLFLISTQVFGQLHSKPSQIGMGYGSYNHSSSSIYTSQSVNAKLQNPIDFTKYKNADWYSVNKQIRNYDLHGLKRVKQSANLRRSLFVGAKLSGQFQHRTMFIGTKETLQEEQVVDQKTGAVRRTYSFETDAFAELNDYINVSPNVFYRIIINDFLSVNSSVTTGVLIPIRTGIQVSSFTGNVSRVVENEEVVSEYKEYDGNLTFEWYRTSYTPTFRLESSASLELKPSAKKPYYISIGLLVGQQLNIKSTDNFSYAGMHLGLQSQF